MLLNISVLVHLLSSTCCSSGEEARRRTGGCRKATCCWVSTATRAVVCLMPRPCRWLTAQATCLSSRCSGKACRRAVHVSLLPPPHNHRIPPSQKSSIRPCAHHVIPCNTFPCHWVSLLCQRRRGRHRRTRRGGGATALPNSGKTVGKIWAKQEEEKLCVKFRPNQPLCPP